MERPCRCSGCLHLQLKTPTRFASSFLRPLLTIDSSILIVLSFYASSSIVLSFLRLCLLTTNERNDESTPDACRASPTVYIQIPEKRKRGLRNRTAISESQKLSLFLISLHSLLVVNKHLRFFRPLVAVACVGVRDE